MEGIPAMSDGVIGRLGAALLAVALAGCRQPTVAELDERERQDPEIQAAWQAAESGDAAGAQSRYAAILRDRPDLARAHLDLAMLLLAAEEKPVKAIYHFMRYQELRPDSEKRELITRQIRYLTGLIGSAAARSRVAQLERELAATRAELERLRQNAPAAPASVPVPAPAAPRGPGSYVVQEGDTLTRIAQRVYGDASKGRLIFEANRDRMKSMNAVRVGQTLVIPPP